MIEIRPLAEMDFDTWIDMRYDLWPHHERDDHEVQGKKVWKSGTLEGYVHVSDYNIALAFDDSIPIGMVEYSKRQWAEGCKKSPVVYVEGLYVIPVWRKKGIARQMLAYVETWGRQQGCVEMASDSAADNATSIAAHSAFGFHQTRPQIGYYKVISS